MCSSSYRQTMIKAKNTIQTWIVLFGFICVTSIIISSARASTNIPTVATFVYVTDLKQQEAIMLPNCLKL